MSVAEIWDSLEEWSAAGARSGVATLVRVRRSAPRAPGARFAASERGELAGSVSSGCVEGDLHEHIQQVLADGTPRLLHYGITDEMAAEVGLACGGEIDVLVSPHDPHDVAWLEVGRVVEAGEAAVMVTGLSERVRGRRMLVRLDGRSFGTLGDAMLDREAAEATASLFDTGETRILELPMPSPAEAVELFVEAFLPPPRLAIVGATPVAAALCHLATYLGFSVVVIDPREAFARHDRFPDATEVVRSWPEEGLERAGLDRYLNVVVLAHDRKLDVPALAAALRAGCLYVGQIGGGRTQRLRREALAELGFGESDVDRIHGPVGLDIGARAPEEIALSILGEILAVRHGKR
ncbi:MAG: XdhC family protein [Gemmatimonadota bacterium]